ncbi:MAG: 3-hydroxyacyl-ACP dehydratase FabZ [Synergistaceae bacterium]|jgi:3-hydroxyacyl-[acyl-carrier-protein] dehydratase|nr:3-hydroxyacyl-ACP dehydratase FabZ [Synergistaceae bacterium]
MDDGKKGHYVYDINKIREFLPHRYPFLLVDRILEIDLDSPEKRIVGIKNVSVNEPFFEGHFPEEPVMPGVLILEAMGQVGCVMMAAEQERRGVAPGNRRAVFITTVYEAKFRRPIVPGDRLRTEATLLRFRGKIGKMRFVGTVDGEAAAEATLGFVSAFALTSETRE